MSHYQPLSIQESSEIGIADLVQRQQRITPHEVAVRCGDSQISYEQLESRAAELALRLQQLGVGPNVPVGVGLRRSIDLAVAIYAVLKAGGAYVPLDPDLPGARLAAMIEQSQIPLLLTCKADQEQWSHLVETSVLVDDPQQDPLGQPQREPDTSQVSESVPGVSQQLAYIMYTSGSTGEPKGVAMPQQALVNLIRWQQNEWGDAAPARTLQFAALGFDVSFQEMFATWASGGTLVFAQESQRRDPTELLALIARERIERVFLPVVMLRWLAEAAIDQSQVPEHLREIITAGEQLEVTPAVRKLLDRLPKCQLINQYGPTETHVVTSHRVTKDDGNRPPIGLPISGVEVHLLDANGQPVPDGEPGELYLGGVALARGYWRRDDLTRERFVSNPFVDDPAARLYRTGDQVRRLASGVLEFLGRDDTQVKIRGYRVEIDEVVAALERQAHVQKAVVLVEPSASGNRLVGFIESNGAQPEASDLSTALQQELPDYMVPVRLTILERLPLSPNGKIDRKKLAGLSRVSHQENGSHCAPRCSVELQLLQLWQDLLGRNSFGVRDSFFDLGGDSLLAMNMVLRVKQEFGHALPIASLVEQPTIEHLARKMSGAVEDRTSPIVLLQPQGKLQPLFCVHPAGGNALCYLGLAGYWNNQRPLVAIEGRATDTNREPESIPEMAARYVKAIRAFQPEGPYLVGGWSFGGLVALEIAQQLRAAGQQVSELVLLDVGFRYSLSLMRALLPEEVGLFDFLRMPYQEQVACVRQQGKTIHFIPPDADETLQHQIYHTLLENLRAMVDYRPQPYAGRIRLFLGDQPIPRTKGDPVREWQAYCKDLVVEKVPGSHLTLLQEPHVATLAKRLEQALDRCATDNPNLKTSAAPLTISTPGITTQQNMPEADA